MCSKTAILFLGLLAMLFLIFSNVAARDLTETYSNSKNAASDINKLVGGVYPGGRDYSGGYFNFGSNSGGGFSGGFGFHGGFPSQGGGGFPGQGGFGGGRPGRGGFGRNGGRGSCRYGCCGRTYVGGCTGCCRYAGQAFVVQTRN